MAMGIAFYVIGASGQVFAPFLGAQERMATQLSDQLRFAEAYPYWASLADEAEKNGGPVAHVRRALETAVAIEAYDEALDWIEVLRSLRLDDFTAEDVVLEVELLKLTGAYQRVPRTLAEGRQRFPEDSMIQAITTNWPLIEALRSDTMDALVRAYRPHAEPEEYGAVAYRGGMAFITRGVAKGVSIDGWMNQPWTKIAFIGDTAHPEPEIGDLGQMLNRDLFANLKQSRHHDGHIAFSEDRSTLAITRNQDVFDTLQNAYRSALQLVFFERIIGGEWEGPKFFEHNDPHWSTGHAAFTPEGDLVFASDRPGGFGGADLWRCEKRGSGWLAPKNLGHVVNTSGDELFPYVQEDSTLLFSSNGHYGLGGLDLFRWVPRSTAVEHLAIPLNSSADDFALYLEADGTGWLSSNRGDWKDRIYQVEVPTTQVEWELLVTACDTRPIANVELEILDETNGVLYRQRTDAAGKVTFAPRFGHRMVVSCQGNDSLDAFTQIVWPNVDASKRLDTLVLNWRNPMGEITVTDVNGKPLPEAGISFVQADGSVTQVGLDETGTYRWSTTKTVNLERFEVDALNRKAQSRALGSINGCPRPEAHRIALELVEEEELIDLGLILYDLDKANLRPESQAVLDQLVDYMNQRPSLKVELSSHTDSRNSEDYNQELSQRRAESCVNYIIAQGVSANRIVARGYGETRLLNHCQDGVECAEELHQANRRTELRFVVDGKL